MYRIHSKHLIRGRHCAVPAGVTVICTPSWSSLKKEIHLILVSNFRKRCCPTVSPHSGNWNNLLLGCRWWPKGTWSRDQGDIPFIRERRAASFITPQVPNGSVTEAECHVCMQWLHPGREPWHQESLNLHVAASTLVLLGSGESVLTILK